MVRPHLQGFETTSRRNSECRSPAWSRASKSAPANNLDAVDLSPKTPAYRAGHGVRDVVARIVPQGFSSTSVNPFIVHRCKELKARILGLRLHETLNGTGQGVSLRVLEFIKEFSGVCEFLNFPCHPDRDRGRPESPPKSPYAVELQVARLMPALMPVVMSARGVSGYLSMRGIASYMIVNGMDERLIEGLDQVLETETGRFRERPALRRLDLFEAGVSLMAHVWSKKPWHTCSRVPPGNQTENRFICHMTRQALMDHVDLCLPARRMSNAGAMAAPASTTTRLSDLGRIGRRRRLTAYAPLWIV